MQDTKNDVHLSEVVLDETKGEGTNAQETSSLLSAEDGVDAGDKAEDTSSFMDTIRNGFTSFGEKAKGVVIYLGEKTLQTGHFILFHRDLIAFAFVAVALLPLFNFASMGAIAYIAYPALALTVMQLGYYAASSNILKGGLDKKYLKGWLAIDATYQASEETSDENDSELEDTDVHDNVLPENPTTDKSWNTSLKTFASTQLNAFLELDLVKLFSNSLSLVTIKDKWQQAGQDKTWQDLGENLAKIGLLYAGLYLTANALVAPLLVGTLHAVLAFGGTAALVGSYFALAGAGYGAAYAANNVEKDHKGDFLEYGSYALAAVGVVAIIAAAVVLEVTGIASAIFSAVGVASIVIPAAFAFTAYALHATYAVTDKVTSFYEKTPSSSDFERTPELKEGKVTENAGENVIGEGKAPSV
ncbi:MAG: hypothetical protein HON55_05310 [Legionellales bacterium]|nr:hypothetical protein [Legionellales bacterium]